MIPPLAPLPLSVFLISFQNLCPGRAFRLPWKGTNHSSEEPGEMNRLTESEKTFFECFEIAATRPYLGYLAGAVLFFVGLAFYSKGMEQDQSRKMLLAGFFFGLSLFEIIESYLAYRLYTIFGKMKSINVGMGE
jgi:hypothetical protein